MVQYSQLWGISCIIPISKSWRTCMQLLLFFRTCGCGKHTHIRLLHSFTLTGLSSISRTMSVQPHTTYTTCCALAIHTSAQQELTSRQIAAWFDQHRTILGYPNARVDWRRCLRQTLSRNKGFVLDALKQTWRLERRKLPAAANRALSKIGDARAPNQVLGSTLSITASTVAIACGSNIFMMDSPGLQPV
jgi:hypothetical protein